MSQSVFALVVAVEEYGEPAWRLAGATADARLVTDELLRLGVRPENIQVFLSPEALGKTYLFPDPIVVRSAISETIKSVIEHELPQRKEEWLFLFWGGHGILDSDRQRRLFLGDATTDKKYNLDLDSLLKLLRSQTLPVRTLMRQVLVIDACGNAYDALNPQSTLPDYDFPRKIGQAAGRQISLLLSSAKGEKAGHHNVRDGFAQDSPLAATGIYTAAFLKELRAAPAWPPDFTAISARLKAHFEELKRNKQAGQTPTIAYYDDSTGDHYSVAGRPADDASVVPATAGANLEKLAAAIGAIDAFKKTATREELFAALPWPISRPQPSTELTDALALAMTCSTQPFGFEALIDACERLGSDLAQFAAQLDEARPTHAIRWSESVRLRAALRGAGPLPDDAQAARAYRETPAADMPGVGATPEWVRGRRFLFEILRLGAQIPIAQSLFAYLEAFRAHGSPALAAAITQWRTQVEDRLRAQKIEVEPVARPARADIALLQIQFQPRGENQLVATPWWRTGDKLEMTEKLFEAEEIAADDWSAVVTRAFEEALDRNPESEFCIEVILPLCNFEREIDACSVRAGASSSPLGRHYPVVVRPYERIYEKSYRIPRSSWLRKWKKWRQSPDVVDVAVVADTAAYTPEFYDKLARDEAAGVVAFTLDASAPPNAPTTLSPRAAVVENMVAAGVPMALCWRRPPGVVSSFEQWILRQDLNTWPEKIWHYRRGEHRGAECPSGTWPELTLLWDSPDLLPPDYQHRAQAPTQRLSV